MERTANSVYFVAAIFFILGNLWDDPYCDQCFGGIIAHGMLASPLLVIVGLFYLVADIMRCLSKTTVEEEATSNVA